MYAIRSYYGIMARERKPKTAPARKKKPLGRDVYRLGDSFMFPPQVIDDIHIKAELGRYRMRGFSLFKKIPHWDDLTFLPGTLTRFVIEGYREKCVTRTVIGPRAKKPIVLDIPVYRITSYNVCYTKLLRADLQLILCSFARY